MNTITEATLYKMDGQSLTFQLTPEYDILEISIQYANNNNTNFYTFEIFEEGNEAPLNPQTNINHDKKYFIIDYPTLSIEKLERLRNKAITDEFDTYRFDPMELLYKYDYEFLEDYLKEDLSGDRYNEYEDFIDAYENENFEKVASYIDFDELLKGHLGYFDVYEIYNVYDTTDKNIYTKLNLTKDDKTTIGNYLNYDVDFNTNEFIQTLF